ncbi:phosphoribosyltransferase family protein [Streptomyces sp. NPDC050658]|uniref:phosphoribosyltransferase family protein n=1 Tax=unclassified Streptomyces TaxID=2593676 RepID=UPI00343EB115
MTDPLLSHIRYHCVFYGNFLSATGLRSSYNVDLRTVTLSGQWAGPLADAMLDLTEHLDYEAVGGPALGAVALSCAMAHVARDRGRGLDAFVVRERPKPYGHRRLIEGPDLARRRVVVVDDVCDTGRSARAAVDAAQAAGAYVVAVAAVVDCRNPDAARTLGVPFLRLYTDHDLRVQHS